ncbi:hypothetical protein NDU88_006956, partial [Pleurodeles waltl]
TGGEELQPGQSEGAAGTVGPGRTVGQREGTSVPGQDSGTVRGDTPAKICPRAGL